MKVSRPSVPVRFKIVRKRLADGTIREYRYAIVEKQQQKDPDTVAELLRSYFRSPEFDALQPSTRASYSRSLGWLRDTTGQLPITEIKRRGLLDLRDAIRDRRGPGAASGFVSACKSFFAWCRDRDWIDASPALEVKGFRSTPLPAWTIAQADLALRLLPEHLRRAVVLALYSGQRRSDLIAMQWSAYDGTSLRVKQQKTGAVLVIPAHRILRDELDAWRAKAASVFVLTRANGQPWKGTTLSVGLTTAMKRLGLPEHLNIHGLRKLAAARLAEAGCSTLEIGAVTGHRTLGMIAHYTASANQERLAGAAIVRLETAGNSRSKNKKRVP